ncbi:hypothetical protein ACFSMW_05995 [Virgibacillus halophilus]|uniref:Fur-regulated basic protein B n=1 Tax=Tigheibacillus halophilus TaxID=361280 RepID=A0ABU5CD43_9BACI|nr:hypothetical protein [Virgibacillus halophilus]
MDPIYEDINKLRNELKAKEGEMLDSAVKVRRLESETKTIMKELEEKMKEFND